MELLVIVIYAAILGLAAPYVNVRSVDYGQLVPSAFAVNAGAILWGILIWTGLGTANAWTWIIVMLAMPAAMAIGANRLAAARKKADELELITIKSGKSAKAAAAASVEETYVTA
jgi:hypothetical protein